MLRAVIAPMIALALTTPTGRVSPAEFRALHLGMTHHRVDRITDATGVRVAPHLFRYRVYRGTKVLLTFVDHRLTDKQWCNVRDFSGDGWDCKNHPWP